VKLRGKRTLITGASQGLGRAIAEAFLAEGASVAICARTASDLSTARTALEASVGGDARIVAEVADVARTEDVRRFVGAARKSFGGIDVVVCNAGVHGPKGPVDEVDWDDWQHAFAINVFGSVACCREVLPQMKAAKSGKIILLSGGGATKPMPNLSAYAASKAAIVRFGETLAEETRPFGIQVNAVAPGALNTRLLDDVIQAGPAKLGQRFYQQLLAQREKGGEPLSRAASLCVFLASSASDEVTGKLISAIWDPWETLAGKAEDLRSTDIYTLRRIIPEDRGRKWS
jgi:NAD(P)-dependent dehydrogenase (short-subunit alcohol dehydrogenase family)